MYVCMCIYIYIYYLCMYVYIYIYSHIRIHTHAPLAEDEFRVLTAVEMGMRNHELVPGT